jgi:hypothetical protein
MVAQLLPPLVEPVGGGEEGVGIGHVYEDREAQLAGRVPHRIEPGVVDLHEGALLALLALRPAETALPQVEAQRLRDLQADGSGLPGPAQLVGLPRRVVLLTELVV